MVSVVVYVEDPFAYEAIMSILSGESHDQWMFGVGGGQVPIPQPLPTRPTVPVDQKLVADGEMGPKTIRRWQQVMGTTADGVISRPSQLVRAVQRQLKATIEPDLVVDGDGIRQDGRYYKTAYALQKYLGTTRDGKISSPKSEAIRAVQHRLNESRF